MRDPQLIALDIDGTLLSAGRPVSPRVLAGVRRAVASGAHVVLATGRSALSTRPVLAELGLVAGSALCSNGAVRMDAASGEFPLVHRFDAAPAVKLLSELLPGALFAVEQLGTASLVTGQLPGDIEVAPELIVDHDTLVLEPVTRLTAWWGGHTPAELRDRLATSMLAGVHYSLDPHEPWMVAVAEGISKGAALELLRCDLGVPPDATLAIGDGDNDIEMLRWAAHGVAMGQAPDIVKAAAREITGSVDEDGVASILDRWF
jgi:hydroxymethylpyrimidine pyrophosphatase-like HAD family hydrolase